MKPRVLIPVFPGTNCEYDTQFAFEDAGADVQIMVIRNLTAQDVRNSVQDMVKAVSQSQIIMIPGGFSGGDEPDGSGKFITSFFKNPEYTRQSIFPAASARTDQDRLDALPHPVQPPGVV